MSSSRNVFQGRRFQTRGRPATAKFQSRPVFCRQMCRVCVEQVREEVLKTISDCETTAEHLERQLEQRRFVASFLRDFLSRPPRPPPRPVPRDHAPVPPVRLRHRARQPPSPANEQVDQLRNIVLTGTYIASGGLEAAPQFLPNLFFAPSPKKSLPLLSTKKVAGYVPA